VTTDADGNAVVENLPLGKYRIEEVTFTNERQKVSICVMSELFVKSVRLQSGYQ
jgi:hypothetical protein